MFSFSFRRHMPLILVCSWRGPRHFITNVGWTVNTSFILFTKIGILKPFRGKPSPAENEWNRLWVFHRREQLSLETKHQTVLSETKFHIAHTFPCQQTVTSFFLVSCLNEQDGRALKRETFLHVYMKWFHFNKLAVT
jgi:hypothetical protein